MDCQGAGSACAAVARVAGGGGLVDRQVLGGNGVREVGDGAFVGDGDGGGDVEVFCGEGFSCGAARGRFEEAQDIGPEPDVEARQVGGSMLRSPDELS